VAGHAVFGQSFYGRSYTRSQVLQQREVLEADDYSPSIRGSQSEMDGIYVTSMSTKNITP
jgi:hypothetical protein